MRAPVAAYLLEKGADVGASTLDGNTALHRAAESGDVDMLKLLLDRGANVNAQRKSGRTPLVSAVVFGHGAAVRYLLSKGAKANLGDVGLSRAVFQGNVEIVKALLEAGVEVKNSGNQVFPGFGGSEPILVLACFSYNADPQIVRMLLDRGADPTAKSQQGRTPLELARERGYEDVARLLVQAIEQEAGRGERKAMKRQMIFVLGILGSLTMGAFPAKAETSSEAIGNAIRKSLPLLGKTGPIFFQKSGCVSCHNISLPSMAMVLASERGLRCRRSGQERKYQSGSGFEDLFRAQGPHEARRRAGADDDDWLHADRLGG